MKSSAEVLGGGGGDPESVCGVELAVLEDEVPVNGDDDDFLGP